MGILQVRNAASTIVQLTYGDDGMDPVSMEGKSGEPIALPRAMSVVKATTPKAHSAEPAPLPTELAAVVKEELAALDQQPAASGAAEFCSPAFKADLTAYMQMQVCRQTIPFLGAWQGIWNHCLGPSLVHPKQCAGSRLPCCKALH